MNSIVCGIVRMYTYRIFALQCFVLVGSIMYKWGDGRSVYVCFVDQPVIVRLLILIIKSSGILLLDVSMCASDCQKYCQGTLQGRSS